MKIRNLILILAIFVGLSFTTVSPALAQLGTGGCGATSIDTAIGCIPVLDTNDFILWVFRWALGIAGGIAFLLIFYAGIMITTSQGVPDRLKAGQELLFSAISGLILLIFSIFILEYVGVRILGLPLGP